jgi:GntR family transcriptional regulator
MADELQRSPRRVHDLLRSAIRDGVLAPGEPMDESVLSAGFATSRNSVREALRMLVEEGLVRRERGRGTVVVNGMVDIKLGDLMPEGTRPPMRRHEGRETLRTRLIESRVVPATRVLRHRLQTEEDTVFMVEHLLYLNTTPIMVRLAYNLISERPDTEADPDLDVWWTVSDRGGVFERRFGARFGRFDEYFQAVTCDSRTAELLGVALGSPVLLYESVVLDADGRPREVAYVHFRGDLVSASINRSA